MSEKRVQLIPTADKWSFVQFSVRYRQTVRKVSVLAPFRDWAVYGVGNSSDEEVAPVQLDSGSAAMMRSFTKKRAKPVELERFFIEMERCLRSGLPETQALRLVTPMAKSAYFRGVLCGLRMLLEKRGIGMAEAMSQFPGAFDEVAVELRRAGDAGNPAQAYSDLAKRTVQGSNLQKKFTTALITPGITLAAVGVAALTMHFKVLPQMVKNFAEMRIAGAELPLPTKIASGVSEFFHQHPLAYVVPLAVGLVLFFRRRDIVNSLWFQKALVRTPAIGPAYRMLIMSRSLSALAMLKSQGVPIVQSYKLTAKVSGHPEYRAYFEAICAAIDRGRKTALAFQGERWRVGPEGADLAARLEVASVTGKEELALSDASKMMSEEAESRLDALPKVVGPIVTVASAIVVGAMVLAVFMPTFSLLLSVLKMRR